MRRLACVFLIANIASSVSAQDDIIDRSIVVSCHETLTQINDDVDCIGRAANACQWQQPSGFDGGTTAGITQCLAAEADIWDEFLNAHYARLMDLAAEQDKGALVTAVDRTDALRDAQRAWITYRDAECQRVYSVWQGGTIRSNAAAACKMTMTAERAVAFGRRPQN